LVINVLFDMDRAAALMSQLGFTLSAARLSFAGFDQPFDGFRKPLSRAGWPAVGTEVLRRDVLESPSGLNGLVFQAGDVDTCVGELRAAA